jgi:hypothetical protein
VAKPKYRANHFEVTLGNESLGEFDDQRLTLNDAFALENETGLTLNQMLIGIDPGRAKSLQALVWFMRFKAGQPVPLASIDFILTELKVSPIADPTDAKGSASKEATAESGTAS